MLHLEILDAKRTQHLNAILSVGEGFYLAGGTALALQLGHRDSVDFDFFSETNFDTVKLWEKVQNTFTGVPKLKTQETYNTLSCTIDDEIRLSFFGYLYPIVEPIQKESGFNLASTLDVGCMKLSAITGRSTLKDYVDLYFILQTISLKDLLSACGHKFPTLDQNLILKSLVYFDDVIEEPIMYMPGFKISKTQVETKLRNIVQEYVQQM